MTPNKSTPFAALVIKPGTFTIERVEIDSAGDGAPAVHELIGGYFTSCFAVPGSSPRRQLVGYCDDDGLLHDAPACVYVGDTLRRSPEIIVGPVVIMAHIAPDTRSMTELELSAFHLVPDEAFARQLRAAEPNAANMLRGLVPRLVFTPGYDV